jgi:glycosyltransferase involved in cell wall biosynthesis
MNIYWYWPFARCEELGLAEATLRPADRLVIHSLGGPTGLNEARDARYRLIATLPPAAPVREGSLSWVLSRSRTYVSRVVQRRKLIRSGEFDVCHIIFLNYFTDVIDLVRLRRRLPVVCTVNDVTPHQRRLPKKVETMLLGRLYRNAGALVVYHDWLRQTLIADFHVPAESVAVIPYQVPELGDAPDLQSRLGERMVLFFGTFRHNKGIASLLEAIELLDGERERDIRFHFAGRGSPDEEARVRLAARSDPRIIADIGWKTAAEKAALYRSATLVVLPYTSFSSQSGVLHEAYAYRVPVVVADVGALGRTVQEDRTGWVVPPNAPAMLAAALGDALSSRDAYEAALAQTQRVAAARSPAAVGGALRDLYDHVVRGS